MQDFTYMTYLKKSILMLISYRCIKREEAEKYRKIFLKLDEKKQGYVGIEELETLLEPHLSKEQIKVIFTSIDLDKNGKIFWSEFLAATIS